MKFVLYVHIHLRYTGDKNSTCLLVITSNSTGRVLWEELLKVMLHITPLCSLLHTLLKDKCKCLQDE